MQSKTRKRKAPDARDERCSQFQWGETWKEFAVKISHFHRVPIAHYVSLWNRAPRRKTAGEPTLLTNETTFAYPKGFWDKLKSNELRKTRQRQETQCGGSIRPAPTNYVLQHWCPADWSLADKSEYPAGSCAVWRGTEKKNVSKREWTLPWQ